MRTLIAMLVAAVLTPAAWAGIQVSTVDGETIDAQAVTVTADKVEIAMAEQQAKSLARADVLEIVLAKADDPTARNGQAMLHLTGGGALAISDLSLAASKFVFATSLTGRCEVPMEAAAVLYQPSPTQSPKQVQQHCAELKAQAGPKDLLVVAKSDTDWVLAEGVLKAIDAQNITFNWDDQDRSTGRTTVRAIWLSSTAEAAPAGIGTIVGADGSTLRFNKLTMDDATIDADCPHLGARKIARLDVAAIRFDSDRLVNLSDLKPADVQEHGFLDHTFPHRLNLAVSGKPMRLGGQTYSSGLGLHSYSQLTYDLAGKYSHFVAMVGIDDAARPGGDATLEILVDGKALTKPLRLTGKDKPQMVRLNIKNAKQLVIRVDFGQDNIDTSDHVDIALARLVK